jgi:hypothetical protein
MIFFMVIILLFVMGYLYEEILQMRYRWKNMIQSKLENRYQIIPLSSGNSFVMDHGQDSKISKRQFSGRANSSSSGKVFRAASSVRQYSLPSLVMSRQGSSIGSGASGSMVGGGGGVSRQYSHLTQQDNDDDKLDEKRDDAKEEVEVSVEYSDVTNGNQPKWAATSASDEVDGAEMGRARQITVDSRVMNASDHLPLWKLLKYGFQLVVAHFFFNVWNAIDLGVVVFTTVGLIARMAVNGDSTTSRCSLALASIAVWFKFLYFLRSFSYSGPLGKRHRLFVILNFQSDPSLLVPLICHA